jgi:hypothetical protein
MQNVCAPVRRALKNRLWASIASLATLTVMAGSFAANAQATFYSSPSHVWYDTAGQRMSVHGGSVVWTNDTWYWIGEADEAYATAASFSGFNCYSSKDLSNWTFVGDILPPQGSGDLAFGNTVQRPKVLYNAATKTWVMWFHVSDGGYAVNHAGVATSSSVCGTYTYKGSFEPMGYPSFDIGAYQDSNGNAYLLTTDDYDYSLRIEQLSWNYQSVESVVATLPNREAPSMIHIGNRYYVFCSHVTGFTPNDDEVTTATSPSGPWSTLVTFATPGSKTYDSQNSWIAGVKGSESTTYIYIGDRWNGGDVAASGYLWLPVNINGTSVSMPEPSEWTLNLATGTHTN